MMNIDTIKHYWTEYLRYFKLWPKRERGAPPDMPPRCYPRENPEGYKAWQEYWRNIGRQYGNFVKKLDCSAYRWYVITFKDGSKELAYLRVVPKGFWGRYQPPYLVRGLLFPRRLDSWHYAHFKSTRIAF